MKFENRCYMYGNMLKNKVSYIIYYYKAFLNGSYSHMKKKFMISIGEKKNQVYPDP